MEILDLTICEILEKIKNKELTKQEVLNAYKEQIIKYNDKIGAFITTTLDYENIDFEKSSLAGLPIGIKDNIMTKGVKTTCASKMLEDFIAPYNATVVEKLNKEGLVSLGKLNMDEFAMGSSTENSALLKTKNPWDLNKVPGGSSGGSAAAVSANLVPWALGSDTGGSIRQPASYCGVVGLKPTYGLVSRYGLVAFASSLDQIGPITKDVKDSALLLNLITGYDEKDSTSKNIEKVDYLENIDSPIKGKKIAVPKEFFEEGINSEVKQKIYDAINIYKSQGAEIVKISLDIAKESLATYYIIACAEASSNLGRFDGIRYGYRTNNYSNLNELFVNSRSEAFGDEVKRRIILGTYVLSSEYYDAYYKKAQKVRTYIIDKFKKVFETCDAILIPTTPDVAYNIGEKINNPLEMYMADICTVPVNIAGLPAISIPCGVNSKNMPIGMQLIGNNFDEKTILNLAYNFEKEFKFRKNYKPNFK